MVSPDSYGQVPKRTLRVRSYRDPVNTGLTMPGRWRDVCAPAYKECRARRSGSGVDLRSHVADRGQGHAVEQGHDVVGLHVERLFQNCQLNILDKLALLHLH